MTENEEKIRRITNGFTNGRLYAGDISREIECDGPFDEKTYNFHLCPKKEKKRTAIATEITEKRKAVLESLKNLDSEAVKIVPGSGISEEEKDVIYVSEGKGERGGHKLDGWELGGLFKFISAKKNGITYELNFMRFFVEDAKNGDKRVNCILKAVQFDRCMKEGVNQSVDGGCDICYPTCSGSQTHEELKGLLETRAGQSFCFNPGLEFIENDAENAKEIARAFIGFINVCDTHGKICDSK